MDEAISKTRKNISKKRIARFKCNAMGFYFLGFGTFNYIIIILTGIVLITVTNEIVNICYILPVATCDLNLNTTNKGILAGAPYLGMVNNDKNQKFIFWCWYMRFLSKQILSSHFWGFLADTKGRRRVIQPALLVAFLVSTASSFVQNFYVFTSLRFLSGFL